MKIAAMVLAFLSLSVFAQVDQKINANQWAYYGQEFYNGGVINKDSLNKILNSAHTAASGKFDTFSSSCNGPNCYRQVSVGYDNARIYLFGKVYVLEDAKGTYVNEVYCDKNIYFKKVEDASSMHAEVNIEHTWPQSKFSSRYDRGMQKSDMHHLFLSDSVANSDRGNFEFGDLTGAKNEIHAQDCDISAVGRGKGGRVFMPPAEHRGNVARALFYFAVRYEMSISEEQERVLRIWAKADPVDANEIKRHEIIAKIQNIRNPFIDYPELADKISNF